MRPPPTLFLSDLHLATERPAKIALFTRLMREAGTRAAAVYLLGDLVEAWLGDDDDAPPNDALVAALRAVADAGVPVFVMHGNRDFLLGAAFARAAGARLIDDGSVIDLYGEAALLMHGDLLCTDDLEYQALRRTVRDPAWQQAALAHPLAERRALAARLRAGSRAAMAGKDEHIMDVSLAEVEQRMRAANVRLLVHGHTHRPQMHEWVADGVPLRRVVLPDWYEGDGALVALPGSLRLVDVATLLGG